VVKVAAEVKNEVGLHARPAARFVKQAKQYQSSVEIRNKTTDKDWVDGKSILKVLTLGVEQGHTVELRIDGRDMEEAAEGLKNFIEVGLLDGE